MHCYTQGGSEIAFQFETGKNAVERNIITIVANKVISNQNLVLVK